MATAIVRWRDHVRASGQYEAIEEGVSVERAVVDAWTALATEKLESCGLFAN